jgi:hypothetical protein
LCEQPERGEQKTGDLCGIWVYKFLYHRREYLIAYRPPSKKMHEESGVDIEVLLIYFYQAGSRENFYATLKRYLKS